MEEEMATSAQRQAVKRYRKTDKGKAAQKEAQQRYAQSKEGKEALKKAAQKFAQENAEALREYKRLKAREYRERKKAKSSQE